MFDERFSPQFADRPIPTGQLETHYSYVSLADGEVWVASSEEARLLSGEAPEGLPARARAYAENDSGIAAWLEPSEPTRLISPTRLVVGWPDGNQIVCEQKACEGIRELIRRAELTRKDYFHVYVTAMGSSGIDILIYAFFETPDWSRITKLYERQALPHPSKLKQVCAEQT